MHLYHAYPFQLRTPLFRRLANPAFIATSSQMLLLEPIQPSRQAYFPGFRYISNRTYKLHF
jgi:hypothetical protein